MSPAASAAALYTETSGAGEPLVLLHGWAMNLRVFDELRARLAAHYAVTAIDLPGHGKSPWPTHWTCASQLELIAAIVPRGASLIGWSLGGQLALALAAQAAQAARAPTVGPAVPNICRLVLIASTPRFVQSDDWEHGLPHADLEPFARSLEQDPGQTVAQFLELQVRGSENAAATRARLRAALEQHGPAQRAALRAGLALLEHTDLRDAARGVQIPALVIAGEYDRVTPASAGQALARLLPRGQLYQQPRAGHAPFLSHPEAVAGAVLQFLRGESDRAAPAARTAAL